MTEDWLPEDVAETPMATRLVYRALADAPTALDKGVLRNRARVSGSSLERALRRLDEVDRLQRVPAESDRRLWAYTTPPD